MSSWQNRIFFGLDERRGTPSRSRVAGVLTRLFFLALLAAAAAGEQQERRPPRLVLQITVDQLRGDLPIRFQRHFGDGGFRYLLEEGVQYSNAHHGHANTETIVGHASLATGAPPSVHGMVGNVWFDTASDRLVYNIEDERYPLLTVGGGVDSATEIDPTQKAAASQGRSPETILVSTFSDELAIATAGRAKIFAVSVKDRGAVSMAGHAGKAFWFSKATGEFVTSSYYAERYPDWVEAWNRERHPQRYAGASWELGAPRSEYLYGEADDRPWETDFPGYGRTFPHPYGAGDGKYFTTLLTLSPAGDELTADFAMKLFEEEALGDDEVTDYLSVSFSSTDYVGHLFGPSSLEAEDNLRRLDRTLARLFAFVDERVGLDRTLVVLSADHGGPEAPGALRELGIGAEYVDPSVWKTEPGIAALQRRFGVSRSLIRRYLHPYVYLDRALIREHGLDQAEVERGVAAALVRLDGIAAAFSSTDLRRGLFATDPIARAAIHNDHPDRSGDVFVVFDPHRFINDFDGLEVATTHGSPWRYDTFVPILFAGSGIEPVRVYRAVSPLDVAPTLSAFVGIKPPSGSQGQLLVEVLAGQ